MHEEPQKKLERFISSQAETYALVYSFCFSSHAGTFATGLQTNLM
jgi:hypothetical protein